jgi:hypothetical protein
MPEALAEQIPEAVKVSLAAIVADNGTTYWKTPSKVVRFGALSGDVLNKDHETIYVLTPDRIENRTHTGRVIDHELNIDVALISRLTLPAPEHPFNDAANTRWTLQNRMAQDVEKKLVAGDLTLGGLSYNVELVLWEMGGEETWIEGWAVVFGRLRVTYRAERGAL